MRRILALIGSVYRKDLPAAPRAPAPLLPKRRLSVHRGRRYTYVSRNLAIWSIAETFTQTREGGSEGGRRRRGGQGGGGRGNEGLVSKNSSRLSNLAPSEIRNPKSDGGRLEGTEGGERSAKAKNDGAETGGERTSNDARIGSCRALLHTGRILPARNPAPLPLPAPPGPYR